MNCAVEITNLQKKYKGFTLDIPSLQIPEGFATALIGENGAGKTTLLNIMAGIRLDYTGMLTYFGKYSNAEFENTDLKDRMGYTGPGNYYLPGWNLKMVREVSKMVFDSFDENRFVEICEDLAIFSDGKVDEKKKISTFSDGTKMKIMLANVLARDTNMLILDEPASPLDPLMRDRLCEMIHEYIAEGEGKKTVFFSTHNIMDMENVTDYAIIMEHGRVVEAGFVEDLKEKYVYVKGEAKDAEAAKAIMYSTSASRFGFEGICLAKDVEKLAGMDVVVERPSLSQISVAVMKVNSRMR